MQWWLKGDKLALLHLAPRLARVYEDLPLSHHCISCQIQSVAYNAMQASIAQLQRIRVWYGHADKSMQLPFSLAICYWEQSNTSLSGRLVRALGSEHDCFEFDSLSYHFFLIFFFVIWTWIPWNELFSTLVLSFQNANCFSARFLVIIVLYFKHGLLPV